VIDLKTEQKLQHFYDLSIASAQEDAKKLIEKQQHALDQAYNEHVAMKNRQADAELKAESDKLKRDFNKEVSAEQLLIKRQISEIQANLKEKLFLEVTEKLNKFKETQEYQDMLYRHITAAIEFAAGDEMVIYIDPSDEHLLASLTERLKDADIIPTISRESFMGGIRAVIRSKNILIDNSYSTLLGDEKEKFSFDGGCCL